MKHLSTLISKILFLSLITLSLSAQKEVPLGKGIANLREMNLSEIAEKIVYIPLETTEEVLLGPDITNIMLTDEYLFVCDEKNLFQFTPEGKFIRKIGKSGQGPGEYKDFILAVVYNTDKKEIIITDFPASSALVYDFEGKFLRDFKIPGSGFIFYLEEPGRLYIYSGAFLRSRDRTGKDLYIYDDKGNSIQEFGFEYDKDVQYPRLSLAQGTFYGYRDNVFYKNPLENTIFKLNNNKKTPVYHLNLEQYEKLKNEEEITTIQDNKTNMGTNKPNPAAEQKIVFINLFESDKHLYIYYAQEDERRLALYDKQAAKVTRIHAKKAKTDGFIDDLEGGHPFVPRHQVNNIMLSYLPAATLLEKIKSSETKGSLKKAVTNLREDDNQVIQVVYLK